MSVVATIINLKRENGLTTEKRLEIKENGIPRPCLQITQTTLDGNKQVNRYFRLNMYDLADWLCGCEISNSFYCFVCLLFSDDNVWCKKGVSDLKHLKDKVKKHTLSANHIDSSLSYTTLGCMDIPLQLDSSYSKSLQHFNEKVSKNRYILDKIIDCIKFCGAFQLPLTACDQVESSDNPGVFQGLVNLVSELDSTFKEHLDKSAAFKSISKSIQNGLLESMQAIVHKKIKSEIELSDFLALQIDEVMDSSNKTWMACTFRYVLNGNVYERFWRFIAPIGNRPEYLTDIILGELDNLDISNSPEKLIAQSFEGASIMSGKFGDTQNIIKKDYPSATFIHCYAHQLNLILQKAVTQYKDVRIFFANLHSFSSFFETPNRTAVLDELITTRLPKVPLIKWNFNTKCVETVFEHQKDILACLEIILNNEESHNTLNEAISLKNCLGNDEFLYWLNIFYMIMPHCDILFDHLQERYIDFLSIKNYIANFKSSMEKVRYKILNDSSRASSSMTSSNKRPKYEDSKRQIAMEVCDIVRSEIQYRFDFSNHLIIEQLFYTEKFGDYRKKIPEDVLWLVQVSYPFINCQKLKTELKIIYERDDFNAIVGLMAILQLLINNNLCDTFSESVKLLKILCTLPMTTVESERCFATLKRVKAFLRNTTGQDRLGELGVLSLEKALIGNIPSFNQQVINHFAQSKGNRIIDLIFKST